MQGRAFFSGKGLMLSRRSPSWMTMISPGSTSRSNFAPMISSAQVSDAKIGWPSRRPSTSGRMPRGRARRRASCWSCHEGIAAFDLRESIHPKAVDEAVALRTRHEMEHHLGVGGRLIDRALGDELAADRQPFVRLPLCAIAKPPTESSAKSGCTFRRMVSPVVE